jgi:hypothetical protein
MMYHMAENFLRHTSPINEQATPNEIGGYTIVTDSAFATAVANAGGMSMEVCLRGSTNLVYNRFWTSLGVARFARPGWDSRLGPSDGIRDTGTKLGVSFTPTFLENGNWVRLASVPERYEAVFTTQFTHPLLVRCRIVYKPKSGKTGPTFTNDFVITPDGILSTLTSTAANFGMTWPILTFDGATNLTHNITSHIASLSFPGQTDQQNFIALHSSPTITATDAVKRSSYGDLLPVRMVSGTTGNITFIYPRSLGDPSADSVRKSFAGSGTGFSTILGKVKGNIYVGRTSAGGVGTSIDINNDSIAEASFNVNTGFLMQLKTGKITKIETAKNVTAVIYGRVYNLKAYTPTVVTYVAGVQLLEAEQAVLNGPVVASNHAGFTGSGFADYINPSGDYIEWTVNAATAGSFSLKFRYANGSTANRPLQLTVNGSTVNANLAFNVTGDWATWLVSSATANLVQGTNKIRLTATGSSGPNTDNLVVSVSPVTLARNEQSSLIAKIDMSVIAQMNMSDADCLRLVPNPANNILNIYPTGLQKNKQLIVSVISASGATVKTIQTNSSTQTLQFDISSLASGVYSIKLVSGNKILYKKFVKL